MIPIGTKGNAQKQVTPDKTAKAVGSGELPVLATPVLAALMEEAAACSVSQYLEAGDTTVGVSLALRHLAATPVGGAIRAESVVTAAEGRNVTFFVRAFDDAGLIGEGEHIRVVVNAKRFLEKCAARGK